MDLSPGAVDPLVQRVTIERFRKTLLLAELMGAGNVVFHSGYDRWRYGQNIDIWLEASVKTWTPLLREAESYGISIAIENIFEDRPESLKLLVDKINSRHFGLCFDTGHFNLFSNIPLKDWLEITGPHILELHLHDNDGTGDDHLSPGEGTFDFDALFTYLDSYSPGRMILTFEPNSIDEARKTMGFIRSRNLQHG
jgi:sugar phosphate isomerase/epimerase